VLREELVERDRRPPCPLVAARVGPQVHLGLELSGLPAPSASVTSVVRPSF
jgi:hypothetical protein